MEIIISNLHIRPNSSGIKTFQQGLISGILETESHARITLICNKQNENIFSTFKKYKNCELIVLNYSSSNVLIRILSEQLYIPLILKNKKGHFITCSNIASLLLTSRIKQYVVIQGPLALPNIRNNVNYQIGIFNQIYYSIFLSPSLQKAFRVISVSGYITKKMKEWKSNLNQKTRTIHEGVELEKFRNHSRINTSRRSILFVSTLFKYKGIEQLIKAYALIPSTTRKSYPLHIIGKEPYNGEYLAYLYNLISSLNLKHDVCFLGRIDHDELPEHYKKALIFVYPSTIESFGLPILEAMASGVPVIASNRMSIPEICGNASLIIDPDDIESLKNAILNLITSADHRNELIDKGFKNISRFSWKKMGKEIIELIKETEQ